MIPVKAFPTPDLPVPNDARLQTRKAVLDSAERLFSARGVDGASVRDITKAAGANLGAINYHFGSKDRLVTEVFARRLEPVNRARLARLDALEKAAGKRAVELSQIVDAMVRPAVENGTEHPDQGAAVMRLLSRCFVEPNPELKKFVEKQFAEVATRFDAAFLRSVKSLKQEELFWRMNFFFGALHHSQAVWMSFDEFPRPGENVAVDRPEKEEFIRQITAFITAGMGAPSPKKLKPVAKGVSPRRATGRSTKQKI